MRFSGEADGGRPRLTLGQAVLEVWRRWLVYLCASIEHHRRACDQPATRPAPFYSHCPRAPRHIYAAARLLCPTPPAAGAPAPSRRSSRLPRRRRHEYACVHARACACARASCVTRVPPNEPQECVGHRCRPRSWCAGWRQGLGHKGGVMAAATSRPRGRLSCGLPRLQGAQHASGWAGFPKRVSTLTIGPRRPAGG
jgi:hypothetical protein